MSPLSDMTHQHGPSSGHASGIGPFWSTFAQKRPSGVRLAVKHAQVQKRFGAAPLCLNGKTLSHCSQISVSVVRFFAGIVVPPSVSRAPGDCNRAGASACLNCTTPPGGHTMKQEAA